MERHPVASIALFVVLSLAVLIGLVISVGQRRFKRRVARETRALLAEPPSPLPRVELELPAPVARYRDLAVGSRAPVQVLRLVHRGTFRTSPTAKGSPIHGSQVFTADPPGFLWTGRIRLVPGLWFDARDMFVHGAGSMRVLVAVVRRSLRHVVGHRRGSRSRHAAVEPARGLRMRHVPCDSAGPWHASAMRTMLAGLVLITATTTHAAPRTRDAIAAVVAPHHDALRACYEAARAKTPKLEGTFVYTLNIGADGKVTKPVAKAPTPASKALDACVTKELGTLAFGAGDATVINYPFVFKPEDAKPVAGKAPSVDPTLVKMFNDGAELARAGKHAEALAKYRAVLDAQRTKKLVAIPLFVSTVHLHASYALIDLNKLADAEKELKLVDKSLLEGEKLFDYHFTLGNIYGGLGKLKPMFGSLVEAISVAEDMDDYTVRPARAWTQAIGLTMKAKDWAYLKEISEKALQAAQLRGMKDLEVKASVALAEAKKNLGK